MRSSEPDHPTKNWGTVARFAVFRFVVLATNERSALIVLGLPAVFFASHLLYVYLLPMEARTSAGDPAAATTNAIRSYLSVDMIACLGWILFTVSVVCAMIAVRFQRERNLRQGDELQRYRDEAMHKRVSSRDESSIEEYDQRMKQRFGPENDDID